MIIEAENTGSKGQGDWKCLFYESYGDWVNLVELLLKQDEAFKTFISVMVENENSFINGFWGGMIFSNFI